VTGHENDVNMGPPPAGSDIGWIGIGKRKLLSLPSLTFVELTIMHIHPFFGAKLADVNKKHFQNSRYELYNLEYGKISRINDIEILPSLNYIYFEGPQDSALRNQIYAVYTDEGRYCIFSIIDLNKDGLTIMYKTFQKPLFPRIQIVGGFKSRYNKLSKQIVGISIDEKETVFVPSMRYELRNPIENGHITTEPKVRNIMRSGSWIFEDKQDDLFKNEGVFRALTKDFEAVSYEWSFDGFLLIESFDIVTIAIGNKEIEYSTYKEKLELKVYSETSNPSILLSVTATNSDGVKISDSKIIKVRDSPFVEMPIAWKVFKQKLRSKFISLPQF
jgi:hypothetical protein